MRLFLIVGSFFSLFSQGLCAEGPRTSLVGTWKITAFQDDGRDRMERLGAGPARKNKPARVAHLVFTRDSCYIIRGDGRREMTSGLTNAGWKSCQIDFSKSPAEIDLIGFSGKDNSKTKSYPGIIQIVENKLTICYAEQGKNRPEKFESNGAMNLLIAEKISAKPLPLPDVIQKTRN